MKRLFMAVDLPPAVVNELVRIQPVLTDGVRLIDQEQMHLTLHFLGPSEPRPLIDQLVSVALQRFSLTFAGVGSFSSRDGSTVLWAGVKPSVELQELHSVLAKMLSQLGVSPESRPYCPHLTLARCKPEVPEAVVHRFLKQNEHFLLPDVSISRFSLYSSLLTGGTPVYHCEHSVELLSAGNRSDAGWYDRNP